MEKAISVPWFDKLTNQPSTHFDMLNTQAVVPEHSRRIVLSGIDTKGLLQSVDLAVEMNKDGNYGIPVPNYTDSISTKVVKIIQSYVGVVNKMVWRKDSI